MIGSGVHARVSGLVLAGALSLGGGVASAQTADAGAQATFELGSLALRDGRVAEALIVLREVYARAPTAENARWLGMACERSGRVAEAIERYTRYLSDPVVALAPERRAQWQEIMTALRASLAHVVVAGAPVGAVLRVDGDIRPIDGDGVAIDPRRRYIFEVTAEGYEPRQRGYELQPGAREVFDATLVAVGGRISVDSTVADAVVSIDGREVGRGRVEQAASVGPHTVEARAPGYVVFRRVVTVRPRYVERVEAPMLRIAQRQGLPGWVLPTVIAGGVAVVAVVTGVLIYELRSIEEPYGARLGNYTEALRLR